LQINYAIVSSDNSHYLDYWPVIKKGWERIGVTPILIEVRKGGPEGATITSDSIYYTLPLIEGIKPVLQSQIARIWAYKMFSGNIIMSDIDMLPINGDYFTECASPFTDEHVLIYGADSLEKFGTYPMCYILGNSKVMSDLIQYDSWESFVRNLASDGGEGWSTDQWYMTKILDGYKNTVKLNRGWNSAGVADRRIDRIDWRYKEEDVKKYIDAHLPRPYLSHVPEISKLINLL
jgi:hypothetical protein